MGGASELNDDDRSYLSVLDLQVAQDLQLYAWWRQADATRSYTEYFPLVADEHGLGGVNGFFGEAPIGSQTMPVMGVVQEIFYDRPRVPPGQERQAAEWIRRQVQEFALGYYMRIEKSVAALNYAEPGQGGLVGPPVFSSGERQPAAPSLSGFGNFQTFYKLRDGGRIGQFPPSQQKAIVDLREIGPVYDWILLKMKIYDFDWTWNLGSSGSQWPTVGVPLGQTLHLVLVPELISNEESPAPGILGRYGPGVAFLKLPEDDSFVAYGPDQIQPSFEQARFEVHADGQVRVRIPWVTNQPSKIFNIPLNPLKLGLALTDRVTNGLGSRLLGALPAPLRGIVQAGPGFDPVMTSIPVTNLLTGGWAKKELCISSSQLKKEMLFLHSAQNYRTVLDSLLAWNEVRDWLDPAQIPPWIKTGSLTTGEEDRDGDRSS
jgi:hypothetical protein